MSAIIHGVHDALTYLQAVTPDPNAPVPASGVPVKEVNTNGVISFFATKIVPILLTLLGVIFIARAGKGEVSKVMTSSTIVVVGIAMIAGAGTLFFVGDSLINILFK